MKHTDRLGSTEDNTLFARTAKVFQGLGQDYRKNTDTIVSGALSVIGGLFSVYLETRGARPIVRSGSRHSSGMAEALEDEHKGLTAQKTSQVLIRGGAESPVPLTLIDQGIKSLIGVVVMTDLHPSGTLWVADKNLREFTSDHINALQCLAGALGCQTELKAANKDRQVSKIAGKVAHNLNNMLSGLVSYPELILMNLENSDPLRENISFIHESGLLVSNLVQDFLFLSRPLPSSSSLVDPRSVAKAYFSGRVHDLLKQSYPHVRFSFQTEPAIPGVEISELFLTKIITTLLAHSAHGAGPGTRIELHLKPHHPKRKGPMESSGLHISVRDDGPPISQKDIDHLFTPFYTREKMGRPGSGLGLAVVKKIVTDHGGKIRAKSKTEKYNFIDIFLPPPRILADGSAT